MPWTAPATDELIQQPEQWFAPVQDEVVKPAEFKVSPYDVMKAAPGYRPMGPFGPIEPAIPPDLTSDTAYKLNRAAQFVTQTLPEAFGQAGMSILNAPETLRYWGAKAIQPLTGEEPTYNPPFTESSRLLPRPSEPFLPSGTFTHVLGPQADEALNALTTDLAGQITDLTTGPNIGMLAAPAPGLALGRETAALGGKVLASYFTGLIGGELPERGLVALESLGDPNLTWAEKGRAVAQFGGPAVLAAWLVHGAARAGAERAQASGLTGEDFGKPEVPEPKLETRNPKPETGEPAAGAPQLPSAMAGDEIVAPAPTETPLETAKPGANVTEPLEAGDSVEATLPSGETVKGTVIGADPAGNAVVMDEAGKSVVLPEKVAGEPSPPLSAERSGMPIAYDPFAKVEEKAASAAWAAANSAERTRLLSSLNALEYAFDPKPFIEAAKRDWNQLDESVRLHLRTRLEQERRGHTLVQQLEAAEPSTINPQRSITSEHANRIEKPMEEVRGETSGTAPPVAAGTPGEISGPARTRPAQETGLQKERLKAEGGRLKGGKKAQAPAEAVAEVKQEIQQVARTEGQRPAKEVKSELVRRLEEAFSKSKSGVNVPVTQIGRITIEIPGDGAFTIANTKEAIGQVLKDAKRLSVSEGGVAAHVPISSLRTYRERMDRIRKDAEQIYGPRRAVEVLRHQAENPDLEIEVKQREELRDTAEAIEASFPENILKEHIRTFTEQITDLREVIEMAQERLPQLKTEFEAAAEDYDARKAAKKGTAKSYQTFRSKEDQLRQTEKDLAARQERIKLLQGRLAEATTQLAALENELKATHPQQQPEPVGMGGAVPSEFRESAGTPTSIKNATVDAERARRGLPPVMQPARRSFGQVWDEAMAFVDADPAAQDRLIGELKDHARAVTDLEDALLLHRQVDLQNEYGKATRNLAQAFDDAQRFPDRLEAVERHKAQVKFYSDKLYELYDINKAVGTATARGLAARKMMAYEDFTLAKMELELRAAKGGQELTEGERLRVAELQSQIEQKQKAFDDYVAKVEAEKAGSRVDEKIADLEAELKRRPNYDPRIVRIAEEIVVKLEKQADAARLRLKEKFARTSAGVDPTIAYDLGVIGAAKIARFGLDFTKFGAELLAEFGEKVKPYLQAAWDRANLHLENEGAKYGDKSPQVTNLLRKRDEMSRRENIVGGLKKGAAEGTPVEIMGAYVQKLAESFVRAGIKEREPLIDAVHKVLTEEVGLDIGRRETMDAISGYGKFKALNPNEIKATLRDLKGQMQQVAKLEDIQAREPLQKTGVQRRIPSDEERRLIQQVNEAKRRFGVVVTDPARQLKSALDAIKTRLTHQIADLEYQIRTKERITRQRTPAPFDAETKLLELRRDELKSQFDSMFPRPDLTDAQRLQMATRAVERQIADYEQRIAGGDIAARAPRPRVSGPELEALRARRDALKAEHEALIDAADPGRSERTALATLKARLQSRIADYQERIARGDFARRQPREVRLDTEALGLKADVEKVKGEFRRLLALEEMKQWSPGRKIMAGAAELANLSRNVLTSYDVSAVGRQGMVIGVGNPLRAARGIAPMIRALGRERNAAIVEQEILSRPNAPLYARAKLYLAPHEALHLSTMEEQVMSRLGSAVPGVKQSNRAYITYLNKLRADSFDAMLKMAQSFGWDLNQRELEAIGNYINVATGRGNLYKFSQAGQTLATIFFSPRLVASRFQLLGMQPFYHGSWRTRALIAGEYGKFLAGMAVVYALAHLAGATIETDPRSADFGKLRLGETRIDPLAGLQQASVLLSRLATGETINVRGRLGPIRGPAVPYGGATAPDLIARFLRSKLSPVIGGAVDLISGKNVVGEPVTAANTAQRLLTPLSFGDIYAAMKEQGVPAGAALAILSLFGWGLQTYEPRR